MDPYVSELHVYCVVMWVLYPAVDAAATFNALHAIVT